MLLYRERSQLWSPVTYVHGIVLLERALIGLRLAHEDDDGVRAAEQGVP